MHRIVFGRGDDAQVSWIIPLHTGDEGNCHASGQERVLAVTLLTPSPPRISKNVDIGSPEGQAEESFVIIPANGLVVLGPRLSGDDLRHAVHQGRIPCGGHADNLRKIGRVSGERHPMQTLIPPLVLRDSQTRNCRCTVLHLPDFLLERHLRDEPLHAPIERQLGVQPWT